MKTKEGRWSTRAFTWNKPLVNFNTLQLYAYKIFIAIGIWNYGLYIYAIPSIT